MKKIYSLLVILQLCLSSVLYAQLSYSEDNVDFIISEDNTHINVVAQLHNEVNGSRHLQVTKDRLRLKAVDLVGHYLIFKSINLDYVYKEELFAPFVDVCNLKFQAYVEKFNISNWHIYNKRRAVTFRCAKKDYTVDNYKYNINVKVSELLQYNFNRKRDLISACRLLEYNSTTIEESIFLESFFLKGWGKMEPIFKHLLKTYPASQLQYSLYSNDSIVKSLIDSIDESNIKNCTFESIIENKILFTCAPLEKKELYYNNYINSLNDMQGIWWELQKFIATNNAYNTELNLYEASVFDIIGKYPFVLNVFGMQMSIYDNYYQKALTCFKSGEFNKALLELEKQINYNGLSAEALNLIGATYRLQEKYKQALPYLFLAMYIDPEALYLKGNLAICLVKSNYMKSNDVINTFIGEDNLDVWSKTQIDNLNSNK